VALVSKLGLAVILMDKEAFHAFVVFASDGSAFLAHTKNVDDHEEA
jgi:hypothetical protein